MLASGLRAASIPAVFHIALPAGRVLRHPFHVDAHRKNITNLAHGACGTTPIDYNASPQTGLCHYPTHGSLDTKPQPHPSDLSSRLCMAVKLHPSFAASCASLYLYELP